MTTTLREDTFALIHHDRSTYCTNGNGLLVGNGQIFQVQGLDGNNVITVQDDQGTVFQLQLTNNSNKELFNRFILSKWNAVKATMNGNEDYPDYQPGIYLTLDAFRNDQLTIYA